ncbi:helix-turn-helix domain-containing protein [Nesterenkonia alba]|uniref:helix-turn-helix domain-containing protein n=1 Tax=Nesterenkonia alba TaxID=515814 RepID=UPI0003B6F166|nr:helix-turn-helix domain-containing protein [Nesterenkonia alba]
MNAPEHNGITTGRRNGVQSVERAFQILEVIAVRGGTVTLSEVAAETQLPAATAHRLLRTMIATGFVKQLKNRSYGLGEKLVPIGQVAAGSRRPRSERSPS